MEKSLVLVKPDGLQRGLVGEIISRFEKKGLKIIGLKMITANDSLLNEHYAHHSDKPFFKDLKKFMMSAPIIAIALQGSEGSVVAIRMLVGPTKGHEADAGTIRGDFGLSGSNNIVHASDSAKNGQAEIARFFAKGELFDWQKTDEKHICG
jgi:nucleoside-diphosphate kinase